VRRQLASLLLLGLSLWVAVQTRGRLIEERRLLGLDAVLGKGAVPEASMAAERQIVLGSAALGVFRAVAIDFLWLRAIHLQQSRNYFEAAALASFITSLQPRLPEIWNFQANNLAYNIPPAFPPAERFLWVRRGIVLLRDGALVFNPEAPAVYRDLARVFQHKIGLDFDDAGYLYRSELAQLFDLDPGSPEARARYGEWRLEPEFIGRVEATHGAELDFRTAEAHGLYWAERGLRLEPEAEASWAFAQLRDVAGASIRQLSSGGCPVRAPLRARYAFLPDVRFIPAADEVFQQDLSRHATRLEELYQQFLRRTIAYLFLAGQVEEAQARLEASRRRLDREYASLEELLLELEWSEQAGRKDAALKLAEYLDAHLLLALAGERRYAEGFLALARVVQKSLAPPPGGRAPPGFDDYLRAAARRRLGRWQREPRLAEALRGVPALRGQAREAPEPALPEPGGLPFALEVLDPTSDG